MKKAGILILSITAVMLSLLIGIFIGRSAKAGTVSVYADHPGSAPTVNTEESSSKGKVNINTATMEQLLEIPGIGEAYAQRIIDYREENGPYQSVEDLLNVKGIGETRLESIRIYICIK